MHCRDVIAIEDFSKEDIWELLTKAKKLQEQSTSEILNGYILGSCFFEPSTRTRLSFDSAMLQMGGKVMGFSESSNLSIKKGESLHDTMKMMESYVDVVVMRHPLEGASQYVADTINIPVINAGDGAHQHPTQTFVDLFTIWESQGSLENLSISIVGDLKFGRTVHSLVKALAHFNTRFYFVSPPSLEMPKYSLDELHQKSAKFSFHQKIEEVIDKVDILYMTRIQEERFVSPLKFDQLKIEAKHLENAKSHFKILHPLPRVNEIAQDVDATPFAHYFCQARNAIAIRKTLLGMVLGEI